MYDQIARFYDLTHNTLKEDIPFVLSLAAQTGGPVLELGCGTGRLLRPLAQAGYAVTGVDNSPEMLALAWQKMAAFPKELQERVTIVEGDMTRLPPMNDQFALVIIPYNTFLHLDSSEKLFALRGLKNLMVPDALLFIDLANPFILAQTPDDEDLILENSLSDPATGQIIRQYAANQLDGGGQVLRIKWVYAMEGGQQTAVSSAYYYLFPHQIDLLLQEAGLALDSFYGEYDRTAFREDASRMLSLAWLKPAS